jgi:hypothetical protein
MSRRESLKQQQMCVLVFNLIVLVLDSQHIHSITLKRWHILLVKQCKHVENVSSHCAANVCHRLAFYTSTSKQVRDIHEEARRIANHHKATTGDAASVPTESEKTPAEEAEVTKQA